MGAEKGGRKRGERGERGNKERGSHKTKTPKEQEDPVLIAFCVTGFFCSISGSLAAKAAEQKRKYFQNIRAV